MFTWIIGFIIALFFMKMFMKKREIKVPPGPKGLPLIGITHKVDPTGLHKSVTEWSKEYGDVMKINIFGDEFVILNSFETIYDAFVHRSDEFAGRPSVYRYKVITGFCKGIAIGDFSPKWLAMKRLIMQKLKMYSANVLKLEDINLDCIQSLIDALTVLADSGEAVDLKFLLHRCVTNIVTSMIYGRRVEEEFVQRLLSIEDDSNNLIGFTASGMLLDKFPLLRYFPLNKLNRKLVSNYRNMRETLGKEIQKTKKAYIPGEVNCVMDSLVEHQAKNKMHKEEDRLTEDDLYILNWDVIVGGTMTTTMTLTALFATLVNKPDIQRRMAEEIRALLGNREPCLKDRDSLPFTEAAILEILRYQSMIPLHVPHMTTTDTSMGGYAVPKGTKVFFNLWKVNHDPVFWDMPWEFNPNRFLDHEGKLVPSDHPKRKRLIAFGAGRRVCPGETLARSRLFLLVTSLLQHFTFRPESENSHPIDDPRAYKPGFNIEPMPYKVKVAVH